MKKIYFIIIWLLLLISPAFAASIYVDQTCADCTGNYSIANRACDGSDGDSYDTIQEAFDNMSTGDAIYLRGGTYVINDHDGANNGITIPTAVNGSAWTAGNYNYFGSYVGEWAILDGENNLSDYALGRPYSSSQSNEVQYWLFERFEIKRFLHADTNGAEGMSVDGGPFKFRYLYIHDAAITRTDTENYAAIFSYRMRDSLIEYCYFNGVTDSNNNHNTSLIYIAPYSSSCVGYFGYCWSDSSGCSTYWAKGNIIRYNYFNNSVVGIKWKGAMRMTDEASPAMTYQAYGDDYHHNIFQNCTQVGILRQDFLQFHNNICDTGHITNNRTGSDVGQLYYQVYYNNTVLSAAINEFIGVSASCIANWPQADYHPYFKIYNNIVSEWTNGGDNWRSSISMGITQDAGTMVTTDLDVDYNLIYKPGSATYIYAGDSTTQDCDYTDGGCNEADWDTEYSTTNFTSTAANLFAGTIGAEKYKLYGGGSFSDGLSGTAANSGRGSAHPYLSGVTLPSYLGAANPSDDDWVAGVLALQVTYFTSQTSGSDPTWIEGTGAQVSGIVSGGCTEAEVKAGGETIVIDLQNTYWVVAGATFDAQRQNIINGITAATSPANGWNAEWVGKEVVTAVVRTSNTRVTVTMSSQAAISGTFDISANITITVIIPSTATESGSAITGAPTFQISAEQIGAETLGCTYNANGPGITYDASGPAITAP